MYQPHCAKVGFYQSWGHLCPASPDPEWERKTPPGTPNSSLRSGSHGKGKGTEAAGSIPGLINPAASHPSHELPGLTTCLHPSISLIQTHPNHLQGAVHLLTTPPFPPGPLQMCSWNLKEGFPAKTVTCPLISTQAHILTHRHTHRHMHMQTHACADKIPLGSVLWTDTPLLVAPAPASPLPWLPTPSSVQGDPAARTLRPSLLLESIASNHDCVCQPCTVLH